ncbi:MAG: GNAT family N-acetyltransferase [Candidatus Hydrogenedentales bacterium]
MIAQYVIRKAETRDLAALPAIERAAAVLFSEEELPPHRRDVTVPYEDLASAQSDGRLWVACDGDDRAVGFALADRFEDGAYLDEIDVHPDHGRRGLGTRMIAAVIEWARNEGFQSLYLDTSRHVPWNMPYYERVGFREVKDDAIPQELRAIMQQTYEEGFDPAQRVAMMMAL